MLVEDDDFLVEEELPELPERSTSLTESVDTADSTEPDHPADGELSKAPFEELLPLVLQLLVQGRGENTLATQMAALRRRLAQCERLLIREDGQTSTAEVDVDDLTALVERQDDLLARYAWLH